MKLLKYFFRQTIDVILLLGFIFLLIMYFVKDWNISGFFWIVVPFVFYNTYQKALLAIKIDEGYVIFTIKKMFKSWIRRDRAGGFLQKKVSE